MKHEKMTKAAELIGKRLDVDVVTKSVTINVDLHQATFVMSTSAIDRHGDIVDQSSWILTYFNQNPAFFFNHASSDFPLGKWVSVDLVPDPEIPGAMMLLGTAEFAVGLDDDIDRAGLATQNVNADTGDLGNQLFLLLDGPAFHHFDVVSGHGFPDGWVETVTR